MKHWDAEKEEGSNDMGCSGQSEKLLDRGSCPYSGIVAVVQPNARSGTLGILSVFCNFEMVGSSVWTIAVQEADTIVGGVLSCTEY